MNRFSAPRLRIDPVGLARLQNAFRRQAALAGACAALMLASKETALLHFFALAVAAFVFRFWNLRRKTGRSLLRPNAVLIAASTFLAAQRHAVHLVREKLEGVHRRCCMRTPRSLRARRWSGPSETVLVFRPASHQQAGPAECCSPSPASGSSSAIRRRDFATIRILGVLHSFLAAIYSLIPYKTPWLALNLWLPIALLAGRVAESIWRIGGKASASPRSRSGLLRPGHCGCRVDRPRYAPARVRPSDDETNPYAYAHTSDDFSDFPQKSHSSRGRMQWPAPRIAVIASDPWPLPWYLRHFNQVGFWQPGQQVGRSRFLYHFHSRPPNNMPTNFGIFGPNFFGERPGVLILLWSPAPK